MSAPALSGERLELVHRLADEAAARGEEPNFSRIGEAAGVNRDTVRKHLRLRGISPRGEKPDLPEPAEAVVGPASKTMDVSGDKAECVFLSDRKIVTEKDALEYGEIDTSVWYVKRMKIGAWTTPMRVRRGQDGEKRNLSDQPSEVQCWRISLELERIQPRPFQEAMEALFARMERHAPKYDRPVYRKPADGYSLLLGTTDLHFGKLCWGKETGEDYDLRIAEARLKDAVDDLLARASGYAIEEVVLVIGSDLLHVDSQANTTSSGTPQDTESRMGKIVETVEAAMIWAIERAAQVAPVKGYWVEGNHDRLTSYHIARTARAWFRNHPGVTIDCSPTPRKYHRYGGTLLGMTHGDREKRAELPIIMATERKADWAETTSREWICGHLHSSRVSHSTSVDGQAGVIVRTLRSLSGRDAWHNAMGYVANDQAAEAYLYSKKTGYAGHFVARPREMY